MLKSTLTITALASLLFVSGCTSDQDEQTKTQPKSEVTKTQTETPVEATREVAVDTTNTPAQAGLQTLAEPESITVLVNKQYSLPEDYQPTDLVYPDVKFIFNEQIEKRMMRAEAATALEELFAAAETESRYLAGVSAYRSHQTQQSLFDNYVAKDGLEKAKTYSALPGTSEHETGLSVDVTTSDGACAAQDCFGDTAESEWLAENAHKYGFIIRYPEGQEGITGYKYEPWHIRYVGIDVATELFDNKLTLEEYYNAVPVDAKTTEK